MADPIFVPADFAPPTALDTPSFRLRPLGPEHNAADFAAWSSSMDHIHRTPGFIGNGWPTSMTLEENLDDLERHADDFEARRGFTFTVLAADADDVIGCVYIYPADDGPGARVRSWVRASDAALDVPLHDAVASWLARDWPFERVVDFPRD